MKKVKIISFIVLSIYCASCSKEISSSISTPDEESMFSIMNTNAIDGSIGVLIQTGPSPNPKYSLGGAFFSSSTPGGKRDGGPIIIDGMTFIADENKKFQYFPVDGQGWDSESSGKEFVRSLYGKEIEFSFSGEGIEADTPVNSATSNKVGLEENMKYQGKLYSPEIIRINSPMITPGNVPRINPEEDGGLKVEWNADPNNKNNIQIQILYTGQTLDGEGHRSVDIDARKSLFFEVSDNGVHIIDAEELSELPENAFVQLRVTRGNGKLYNEVANERYLFRIRSIAISLIIIE